MQKAGLLAALALTVAVAIYAYPKADRSGSVPARIGGIGTEHDSSQPTPLDKLKAATRVGVPAQDSVLPPPRVMEQVKQEIQARPFASETVTPRQTSGVQNAADAAGLDKLARKLPGSVGQSGTAGGSAVTPVVATPLASPQPASTELLPSQPTASQPAQPQPAQTQPSTLVIPAASAIGAAAASTVATGATPSAADIKPNEELTSQAKAAETKSVDDGKPARAGAQERRRAINRDGGSAPRNAAIVNRAVRHTSVFNRNDGM